MGYKALLIGNWTYDDPDQKLNAVHGPEHNLPLLQQALVHSEFGLFDEVDVCARPNLTGSQIGVEIENFIEAARHDDQLLFYYTGHGVRTTQGSLALCGVDVTFTNKEALSFDTSKLRGWIDRRGRAQSTILVLDCCYSGSYLGTAVDEKQAVTNALGEGIAVLSSGGNEPVSAAFSEDSPTEFTSALTKVLVDAELLGHEGYLRPSDVDDALGAYKLPEKHQLNVRQKGTLVMARREAAPSIPAPTKPRLELRSGFPVEFETVTISFAGDTVTVFSGTEKEAADSTGLDDLRKLALRRLLELVDAVVRTAPDVGQDPELERLVRRSWQSLGANLLASALPPSLHQRLTALGGPNQPTLRLRLRFDEAARELARYPWEYLFLPGEVGSSSDRVVHPIGLRRGVMIERSLTSAEQATTTPVATPKVAPPAVKPARARSAATTTVSARPSQPGASSFVATPKVLAPLEVGIVNGYGEPYARLGRRLSDEVELMPSASLAFTRGLDGGHTSWADVIDRIEDTAPHCLVLMTPLEREQGNLKLRFPSDADGDGRRGLDEVVELLRPIEKLQLIAMVNVAAPPSRDTFGRCITVAERLSEQVQVPVVFMCHPPGLETVVESMPEDQVSTFTGTLLHALSEEKPLDQSFCHARDWVMKTLSDSGRLLFGAPGMFTHGEAHDVLAR